MDVTGKVIVSAIILPENQKTLNNQSERAHFDFLNKTQADTLNEIDPQLFSSAKVRNPDDFEGELNQLIQYFQIKKCNTPTGPTHPDYTRNCRFHLQRPVTIFLI